MFEGVAARKLFGSANERGSRSYQSARRRDQRAGAEVFALSDERLKARTEDFKKQLADGKTLDDILVAGLRDRPRGRQARHRPAPFRRAADRRHDPARRRIAEMKTGEGKTLVATLAVYLNALAGKRRRTSSPSTTTWPSATPNGWARSTASSA